LRRAVQTPVVLSFSGGKDSVLALARLRASGQWDVRALLAAFIEDEGTLVMHEVPERLVALQASSLGVPLVAMRVPRAPSNAVYEERLGAALAPFKAQGVRHVAFGDLFLEDIRTYRDALMARLGFEPVYPLWGTDTRELALAYLRDGYRGVTVCVDATRLGREWSNRDMDATFFAVLPAAVDPCGERGEFHSFVYDGPGFAYPVRFVRREVETRGGFHYGSLAALSGDTCARCGAAFECGMKAGQERCWCVDAPHVHIDPSLESCLCPRCLALEAVSADRRSSLL
jgi:uncharacterized protein (TIGR00290 family)